jgi:hypothetical protein
VHLVKLVGYIQDDDWTNVGWEFGAIAYDLKCAI